MLRTRRGLGAWRWAAALVLMLALALPFLPTAAYAAPAEAPMGRGTWYVVVAGDTLSQIARNYGTSVNAIMDANGLTSTRIYVGQHLLIPTRGGGEPGGRCDSWYVVRSGDNLSRIAARFGVNVWRLAADNHISNPRVIIPGQRLCINGGHDGGWHDGGHDGGWDGGHAGGCFYTVRAGDNLSMIAKAHGVSWSWLARINHLSNPRVIIPGQRLNVCG